MAQVMARLFGLGGRKADKGVPRDLLVDIIGTHSKECFYIRQPSVSERADEAKKAEIALETEYFMNLYAIGSAHRRQKVRLKKGKKCKRRKHEPKLEHPEFPVDIIGRGQARLIYDINKILHITHPQLDSLNWDLVSAIDESFYGQDFSEYDVVIAYPPSSTGPYRFMAIARRADVSKGAISQVPGFDKGSGEGQKLLWNPNPWHPERVVGKRYAVPTKEFMSAESSDSILYLPIEGLAEGKIADDIGMMTLACCADAFSQPKEG